MNKYWQILILNQPRYKAISIYENFLARTNLFPRKLSITCLSYSYLLSLQHLIDIIYLPNSCEAGSDSFFITF